MSSTLFKNNQQINKKPQINPQQMQMINNFLKGKNMTPEQAVRSICQQRGIDVDDFMRGNGLIK